MNDNMADYYARQAREHARQSEDLSRRLKYTVDSAVWYAEQAVKEVTKALAKEPELTSEERYAKRLAKAIADKRPHSPPPPPGV
jgi:hypothetical protein